MFFWLIPIIGVIALIAAIGLASFIKKQPDGNDKMKDLAKSIHEGAQAFLFSEYKILIIFIIIVFLAIGFGIGATQGWATGWGEAICFIIGAIFSTLCGYLGMNVATHANVRTTAAAKDHGMVRALLVAFRGGAVMGLAVVGLGLFGVSMIYFITGNAGILFGYSLGASSIALFARVGGGIYTKAADVGADLVGKVEAGIPEDDPRNPAVIADNVGDNVGDVAGMGADLFESYVGSIVSAISLGILAFDKGFGNTSVLAGALFPLLIAAIGVLASILGIFLVRGKEGTSPSKSMNMGTNIANIITVVLAIILSKVILGTFLPSVAIIAGLIVGILIGRITEWYTSDNFRHVKKIAEQSETGTATNIISGIATGMQSAALPIIFIVVGIIVAYGCGSIISPAAGVYCIALAAVGMLATTGNVVAVDTYGPIADNAGGIAEMAGLEEGVRDITDHLDSIGNTTAAIGKGFAIGSAALTALSLFVTYAATVGLDMISLLSPSVIVGLLIGAMLPFLFTSITMEAVSKAAYKMIEEVRRQFRENPGILEGTVKPDHKRCVSISTQAALREMLLPGIIAIAAPIVVGIILGAAALGGLLAGALATGVMLAIFMSNAGGAWDNAKKYIESGNHGGKGSEPHKAAVVGDTVGDPFKDTSGPSINILIKLMTIVSLVFAPLFASGLIHF